MVRLKHQRVNKTRWVFKGLNSTMVRLKQTKGGKMRYQWFSSQFHYGSIKTYKRA